jgi:hypothetical protein
MPVPVWHCQCWPNMLATLAAIVQYLLLVHWQVRDSESEVCTDSETTVTHSAWQGPPSAQHRCQCHGVESGPVISPGPSRPGPWS